MKIWIAPYELQPRTSLNSRSTAATRSGALLRVETGAGEGFADLHPWPELGDETLLEQLDSIISGRPLRLAERSLYFAQKDAEFRARNVNAFEGLTIPPSHFFIPDIFTLGADRMHALVQDGFRTIKIKVGRNVPNELQQLQHLSQSWPEDLRIRFDFNSNLTPEEADDYMQNLPAAIRRQVEFAEDPARFSVESWTSLRDRAGFALALDLEADNEVRIQRAVESGCVEYIVLKPAIQDCERIADLTASVLSRKPEASQVRFSVTTYLDHPFGQMTAAWMAAHLKKQNSAQIATCGLLSHISSYEQNAFSELMENRGPNLLPVSGKGFGFDELLSRQVWKAL